MESAKARGLKMDELRIAYFKLLDKHLPLKTKDDVVKKCLQVDLFHDTTCTL